MVKKLPTLEYFANLRLNATKIGKSYYSFIVSYPVVKENRLYYGVYPINLKTKKPLNIIEYIKLMDIVKGKEKALQKAKKNLIRKLKKRR